LRPERREARLQVGHHRAGRLLELDPLGARHPRLEAPVDEQPPDLLERVLADQLLDVDAAIAKGASLLVRLRDLGLERDDAFESRAKVLHECNGTQSPSVESAVRWLTA